MIYYDAIWRLRIIENELVRRSDFSQNTNDQFFTDRQIWLENECYIKLKPNNLLSNERGLVVSLLPILSWYGSVGKNVTRVQIYQKSSLSWADSPQDGNFCNYPVCASQAFILRACFISHRLRINSIHFGNERRIKFRSKNHIFWSSQVDCVCPDCHLRVLFSFTSPFYRLHQQSSPLARPRSISLNDHL